MYLSHQALGAHPLPLHFAKGFNLHGNLSQSAAHLLMPILGPKFADRARAPELPQTKSRRLLSCLPLWLVLAARIAEPQPRSGGITSFSRRQVRRSPSVQLRNFK